jgi:hypothetical protein
VEEYRHQINRCVGPAVRVVVIPGTLVHTTEAPEAAQVSGRPWPGLFQCEEGDEECIKQAYASLREGEVCPGCGHKHHETGADHYHGYIDYSVQHKPVPTAAGEPIAMGEICKCPCHKDI